ncbi:MAG TPA: NUDIX domain-containing protein [Candidatus Paceibacterota bacterium]
MNNETILEFGTKRENEERRDGGCGVVFDPKSQKYAVNKHQNGLLGLFSGGVDPKEDIKAGVLREVTEESGLDDFLYIEKIAEALTHYRNILKNVNRVAKATCFLVILKSTREVPVHREAHETFTLEWATAEKIVSNWESWNENKDHDHWIYFMKKAVARAKELGYDTTSNLTLK